MTKTFYDAKKIEVLEYPTTEPTMTRERFCEIMNGDSDLSAYREKDNALLGLLIITKYLPGKGIEGADHDVIYSVAVDALVEAGITEEDATELCRMNWMIQQDEYLACFV